MGGERFTWVATFHFPPQASFYLPPVVVHSESLNKYVSPEKLFRQN